MPTPFASRSALTGLRAALPVLMASLALAGCASNGNALGYYWQSVRGHVQLMRSAEPLEDWVARTDIPVPLRERLQLAQRARAFAVAELGLPDNASYRRYADLKRAAAVWNVVAAPPYSLTLHTWCFPVTGCIGYRGYFDEADARAEADRLAKEGLEVEVYGVPAYSTLGYMNWAGGDPLLSTFIGWPEGEFVRLLFHELAHQVVYAKGDTLFNESFATAVERLGSARWLAQQATPQASTAFAASEVRRRDFRALTQATRERLAKLYAQDSVPDREALKAAAMQSFRADYAALRERWQATPAQTAGYDRWVASANNASFGAQAAYNEFVPAFVAIFEREGRDWRRFYDAVRVLSEQPQAQRHEVLRQLLPNQETPGA